MRTAFRGGRFVVHTAIVIGLLGAVLAPPARAQTSDATQVISLVNSTRASVGLAPVALDGALSAVAQTWAGVMALAGTIMHNPSLSVQVGGWSLLAENVGMGSSIDVVHQALLNSPLHYANMTDARFTTAGAGVVASGGQVFVVQIFEQGRAAPSAPTPTPAAAAAPAPAPAPAPEPEPAPPAAVVAEPTPRAPAPESMRSAPASPSVPGLAMIPLVSAVTDVPVVRVEPSPWLALVLQRLAVLDGALG